MVAAGAEALGVQARRPGRVRAPSFRVAVYFADGKVNLYQMRQWYAPLAELAETPPRAHPQPRVRAPRSRCSRSRRVPVVYVRKVADLEQFVHEQDLHVVFYVNQNAKNFQMIRYGRMWHVFINHGETDKMYMTTNQFKAYDYTSSPATPRSIAARARCCGTTTSTSAPSRSGARRPTTSRATLPYTPDDRTVVLYAPTWEGDRGAAAYGSIASHGVALVRGAARHGRHRLIYRPHPRCGVVDPEYGAANEAIIAAIAAANAADPDGAAHLRHGPELGWQLAAADVAIIDISAMVYDRLATGKPLLDHAAGESRSADRHGRLPRRCEWLDGRDAADDASPRRRGHARRRRARATRVLGRAVLRRHDPGAHDRAGSTRRSTTSWPSGSGTRHCTRATAMSTSTTSRPTPTTTPTRPGEPRLFLAATVIAAAGDRA